MSLTSFQVSAFGPAAAQLRAQEADRLGRRPPQQHAAERRGRRRHQELERGVADLPWRLGDGLVLLGRAGDELAVVGQDVVVEEEGCEDGRALPHVLANYVTCWREGGKEQTGSLRDPSQKMWGRIATGIFVTEFI